MQLKAWTISFLAVAALSTPVFASSPDDKIFDQETITALEARITQAQPREQCFLYAELIQGQFPSQGNPDADAQNAPQHR